MESIIYLVSVFKMMISRV